MASALKKIVVFLSLIAFTLSSIIGLASGLQIVTIIIRGLIVFVIFAIVGWVLVPLFIGLWGKDPIEEDQYAYEDEKHHEEE